MCGVGIPQTTVMLGLQQLLSDTKLNRTRYYYLHMFCIWNLDISPAERIWMQQQNHQ